MMCPLMMCNIIMKCRIVIMKCEMFKHDNNNYNNMMNNQIS